MKKTLCSMKKTPKTLLPQKMEVIGALGCVPPSPMLSGKMGNVGLVSFKCKTGVNWTIKEINERGALLLWNPPNSPDLNCIEKCWDIANKRIAQKQIELSISRGEASMLLTTGDLLKCLQDCRLTSKCFEYLFL